MLGGPVRWGWALSGFGHTRLEMRARRTTVVSVLAIAIVPLACTPSADTAIPELTEEQATAALMTMVQTHPGAFRMSTVTIRPEESERFMVDTARNSYRIIITSGGCDFDYEGAFGFWRGTWFATQPELRSVAKHRR
jgi:hypothetical protein